MTPDQQFWLAMLAQLSTLALGLIALWLKVDHVKSDVAAVHDTVNSKMSELIGTAAALARSEGVASVIVPGVPAQTTATQQLELGSQNAGSIDNPPAPGAQ